MTCKILLRRNFNGKSHFFPPSGVSPSPPPVFSAPPRSVSVVQLINSSTVSVSWEPPPQSAQSGPILEYKVRPAMLAMDLRVAIQKKKKKKGKLRTGCSGSLGGL